MHMVAQFVQHCATTRKVTGSIPYGVTGVFHWLNPSGHTVALGLTQPLTEITRNISWEVKAASVYGWQTYLLHVPIVLKSGSLNLLEPSGPVQACNGIALPFTCVQNDPFHSIQFWGKCLHRACLTLRLLMSYIYGAPILDVSRSHTTTQHSR